MGEERGDEVRKGVLLEGQKVLSSRILPSVGLLSSTLAWFPKLLWGKRVEKLVVSIQSARKGREISCEGSFPYAM